MIEAITDELLYELNISCVQCGITDNIIDMQSLHCPADFPKHIVYLARLRGSAKADSSILLSHIVEWVKTESTVNVAGTLMSVDPKCNVQISSFNDTLCPYSPTSEPIDRKIIIASIASAALVAALVIVTVAVVYIVKMCRRYCRHIRKKIHVSTE